MKRLQIMCIVGAVAVATGCSTDTATKEAKQQAATGGNTPAADTAAAVRPDTTATDTAGATALADSTMQVVVELTLHAMGEAPEDMRYDKDTLTAQAGAFIKLQLINDAHTMPMMHNVVFTMPGKYEAVALAAEKIGASGNYIPKGTAVIAASPMALPGQTITLEFTAPAAPGVYEFVCTYPGHWQRMHGKFIVE